MAAMRVGDLTDRDLDFWVARAYFGEGVKLNRDGVVEPTVEWLGASEGADYSPSTNWLQGGQIIDSAPFGIFEKDGDSWRAGIYREGVCVAYEAGSTVLVAAMRAYVASRFGDEVPESP